MNEEVQEQLSVPTDIELNIPNDLKSHVPDDLKSLQTISKKILESKDPMEYIKSGDIDLVAIYRNLGKLALGARRIVKWFYDEVEGKEVPVYEDDNRSQIAASELILELAKHISKSAWGDTTNIFNLTIEQRTEIKGRMERIFGKNVE